MALVVRVTIEGSLTGLAEKQQRKVDRAIQQAAKASGRLIEKRGRADIRQAGKFGSRWTQGLVAPVTEEGESTVISVQQTGQDTWYWRVFEYGAVIKGRPLLWIPLKGRENISSYGGSLFFTKRKRDGLLLAGDRSTGEMKFFAKPQVRIPKKFHIVQITHDVARGLPQLFRQKMGR